MKDFKVVKFIKFAFTLFLILTLVFIVAIAVSILNPIIEQGGVNVTAMQVKGAFSEGQDRSKSAFLVDFLINSQNSEGFLIEDTKISEIDLSFSKLETKQYIFDFVELKNPNPLEIKVIANLRLSEELKKKSFVFLEDSKDSLILYSSEKDFYPKTITLNPYETRMFKLRVNVLSNTLSENKISIGFNSK